MRSSRRFIFIGEETCWATIKNNYTKLSSLVCDNCLSRTAIDDVTSCTSPSTESVVLDDEGVVLNGGEIRHQSSTSSGNLSKVQQYGGGGSKTSLREVVDWWAEQQQEQQFLWYIKYPYLLWPRTKHSIC
jgi:hypothetical protein